MTLAKPSRDSEYDHLAPLFDNLNDPSVPERARNRIRERLIAGYLPVAHHIAMRYRNRGQPDDDLTQVATLGLIHAIDRFEPGRGSDFVAFAVPTITGEIRRYFRDCTWAMRVPRRLKELHATLNKATADLGQRIGRSPRPSELAAHLNLPVDEVYEGLQAGLAYRGESLEDGIGDDGTTVGPVSRHLGMLDHELTMVEAREALYPALRALPERELSIVMMRFFGNMTQTQIAERIGLSQMHVSRLLAASLGELRRALDDEDRADESPS